MSALETIKAAYAAFGRPPPPVGDLDAVAVARSDIVGPGIDDQCELALPLAAAVTWPWALTVIFAFV